VPRRCARSRGEQSERVVEGGNEFRRGGYIHARGGELDRQRQPIEAGADPVHARFVQREGRVDGSGSVDEQLGRCRRVEGFDRLDDFSVRSKALAAGSDHRDPVGVTDDPIDDTRDRLQEVLTVVEDEQQTTARQSIDQLIDKLIARVALRRERRRPRPRRGPPGQAGGTH